MQNIALIQGHPDDAGEHLCHALAASYAEGAVASGHTVTRIEIAELDFPLLRSQHSWQQGQAGTPAGLASAQSACIAADHLVLVFPLWLGTMPALLKAFLEQTFRPGVALAYGDALPQPLFSGKSARIIVTMGMPSFAYRVYYRAHGLKNLQRSILGFAGVKPVRSTLFGMVEQRGDDRRKVWLQRVHRLGQRAA